MYYYFSYFIGPFSCLNSFNLISSFSHISCFCFTKHFFGIFSHFRHID